MSNDFLGLETHQDKWARAATFYAVSVALALIILKFIAWQGTGAVAISGSVALSIVSVIGSLKAFFACRLRLRSSAYRLHPLQRASHYRSFAGGFVILSGALYVGKGAIERLLGSPAGNAELPNISAGFAVMGISLILTLSVILAYNAALRRDTSPLIQADRRAYLRIIFADSSVMLVLIVMAGGRHYWADAVAGLLLAVFSGRAAWRIYRDNP